MIQIKDKKECCGCTACYSICPHKAISMKPDEEGFLYPFVERSRCVNCNLCEKVCPVIHKCRKSEDTKSYIMRYKNEKIVENSTSGGAFSAIAELFFRRNAIIYGAGYDDNMNVICKKATDMEELAEMRGSKFVQSNLNDVFSEIKNNVRNNEQVIFSGTPCQVAGLIGYLGQTPVNLFCIDFVCRGVPSPALWKSYLNVMEKKYASKIVGVKFKNKTYGYHATTMKVDFENGKSWLGSGRVDPMMKAFVSGLASRPSCSSCSFKGVERLSDITMFDCYEFSSLTGEKDDDKGYTSLLIHSDKGIKVLEELKSNCDIWDVPVNRIVNKNGIMVCNSARPHPKREEFYHQLGEHDIEKAINIISPIKKIDYFIEGLKEILYKTGLIKIAKILKNEKVQIKK